LLVGIDVDAIADLFAVALQVAILAEAHALGAGNLLANKIEGMTGEIFFALATFSATAVIATFLVFAVWLAETLFPRFSRAFASDV